jgi:hypothetical protein
VNDGQADRANRWLAPSLAAVAVVLAGVALALAISKSSSTSDDVDALQTRVGELEDAQSAAPAEDTATAKDLTAASRRLKRVEQCLPELQNEINSMEVSSGFAFPSSQVSTYCNDLMYPNPPNGE